MNLLDIIIIIPLIWALYNGYRKGIISQVGGLVGLIVGVFAAYYLGEAAYKWLNVNSQAGKIVTFVVMAGVVLFVIVLAARMVSGVFKAVGIGWLDRIGGALLCALKIALVISIVLLGFEWLNDRKQMVKPETLSASLLYYPIMDMTSYAFPYVDKAKEKIEQWDRQSGQQTDEKTIEGQGDSLPDNR